MINLNDYLSVGQNAVVQKVVQPEDASDKYISAFKELLSAPRLIHWAIDASLDAIDPYLPEEYASIGTSISFNCTAPTSVGMTVTVHVTIKEIGEREVVLAIEEVWVFIFSSHIRCFWVLNLLGLCSCLFFLKIKLDLNLYDFLFIYLCFFLFFHLVKIHK